MGLKYKILFLWSLLLAFSCGSHSHSDENEEGESHHHEGEIVISHETAENYGIVFERVTPGKFRDVIKTTGVVETSGSDLIDLTSKRSGIVTLAPGISEGVEIKSGQVIARVSPSGIQGGDTGQAAMANLEAAKAEFDRLSPLYAEGLVTASAYREAERQYKEALALAGNGNAKGGAITIVAPSSGSLVSLQVKNGQFVDVGSRIGVLAKNSQLTLKADLPARESRHFAEITSANFLPEGGNLVKLEELEGKKISGARTSAVINGYMPVYFTFSGNSMASPGGYAEVFLLCSPRENVISVPREALVELQGNKYLYVVEDGHEYEKRLVATGASDGERVEILSGLEPDEEYVVKGASAVRMIEMSSVAPPAHNHSH